MKIKPGTYISNEGLTEEQFDNAVKAFEEAGFNNRYPRSYGAWDCLGINRYGDIDQWNNSALKDWNFQEITYAELVGEGERSEHPHYELIEKYYREWGQWDCYLREDDMRRWLFDAVPSWYPDMQYELRPRKKMMKIGDYEFPEPEREAPEVGTTYYIADTSATRLTLKMVWNGDWFDKRPLKRGRIHLSESAAIAHAKAEIKASGGEVDESI